MSAKGRDKELRELVEQVVLVAEAAVTLAFDKGWKAGQRDARTPLARRRAGGQR
jgi:predicted nucleotidyltransferase